MKSAASVWASREFGPEVLRQDGRVVLVTGAAQGIGEAIAIGLARCGASLAICDRDAEGLHATAREIEQHGQRAYEGVLDVRKPDEVEAFLAEVHRSFGVVHGLVNNAGGGFVSPFAEIDAKGEDVLIRENFTSVTSFVRATLPSMSDGGSIVNLSSVEAHRGAPGFAIYAAMKSAVESLSRSLALELAPQRIRVNAIAPDMIPTPGVGFLRESDEGSGEERKIALQPWPESGSVWDCAAAAAFLLSDAARFITGTTLHVDGGTWAAGGWKRFSDDTYTL